MFKSSEKDQYPATFCMPRIFQPNCPIFGAPPIVDHNNLVRTGVG